MASTQVMYKTRVVFTINDFIKNISEYGCICEDVLIESNKWHFVVYLRENNDFGFSLKLNAVDAEYKVYIRDIDGNPFAQHFEKRQEYVVDVPHGTAIFVTSSQLLDQSDKYLPNNTLTIVCDITVFEPTNRLKRRRLFGNSFNDKNLNDCRLVVKGKEFFASKALLSDHSEVFYHMFKTNMSEKTSNNVVIDDIDADVFEEFYRYLYFGDSEKLYSMVEDSLYVADKYMVSHLKTICANLLYLSINPRNALNILKVLEKHRNEELVAKTIKYIKEHWNQCLETEWPKLVGNDCLLIVKLIDGLKTESNVKKTQIMSYSYIL